MNIVKLFFLNVLLDFEAVLVNQKIVLRTSINTMCLLLILLLIDTKFDMFIKVLSGSEAERVGLKRGDKLLSVNNVDFNDIEHEKVWFN